MKLLSLYIKPLRWCIQEHYGTQENGFLCPLFIKLCHLEVL
jgi:hypothetical protein